MIYVLLGTDIQVFKMLRLGIEIADCGSPKVGKETCDRTYKELLVPDKANDHRVHFEGVADEFSRWVSNDEVTVLVARVSPLQLNPLLPGFESLLAMLILAFPEVHWLFGTIRGYDKSGTNKDKLDIFRARHGLYDLFQPEQSTLFDGTGLRDGLRQLAIDEKETKDDACYIPRREQLAVAMDEETDYAHLHAYTAYRFGFRALSISRRLAANAVLGKSKDSTWSTPHIVLEDLFLNFPDDEEHGLSDLCKRCSNTEEEQAPFPRLEDAEYRILVTSGQRIIGDAEKNTRNKQYRGEQKAKGKKIEILYKPHAGIFSVWEKSGLDRRLRWNDEYGKVHKGTGELYIWPPDWPKIAKKLRDSGDANGLGHSSPGIFLLIARHLLNRAESMLANGLSSVEEAVHGAVLANDALELLGGKTPTTAAEALSLKHQFELHAECQFTGVEHHVPLRHRLKEIKRDAESISRWFRPQERHRAALNIQMNILNQLVRILRQYNQFDEEQECMNRVRHLHNSLYLHEHPWWRFLTWPILRYSEFLLSSFSRFAIALILWVGGLTWLFGLMHPVTSIPDEATNLQPFAHAISTFLGINPITSYGSWLIALSVVAIVAGLAHLGIFISHLYVLVSKR